MNQQELWNKKWASIDTRISPPEYAKKMLTIFEGKNVLELGCGTGSDSIYFAQHGFEVTATDFSDVAIKRLKKVIEENNIQNITASVADIQNLQFKQKFDVIYANCSLHYFNDETTTKIFTKLHELLNEGGLLCIRCKSTKDEKYGEGTELEKDYYNRNGHVRHFFSKGYMKEKLKLFTIVNIEETSSEHLQINKEAIQGSFIEAIARKDLLKS